MPDGAPGNPNHPEGGDQPGRVVDANDSRATPPVANAALIFVGGLSLGIGPRKTAAGVVRNIARACEEQTEASAAFAVQWHDAAVRANTTGLVATILRVEGSRNDPVLDIYSYEWSDDFVRTWHEQPVLLRLAKALFALTKVTAFIRFFRTAGSKNPMGHAQLLLVAALVVILAAYTAITAYAAYQVAAAAVEAATRDDDAGAAIPPVPSSNITSTDTQTATDTTAPMASTEGAGETGGDSADSGADADGGLTREQWVAAIGALPLLVWRKLRQFIITGAETVASAHGYLEIDAGKGIATSGLTKLIEDVSAKSKVTDLVVCAYSFGSLVAIDTLIPTTGPPPKVTERVTSLVTIGSPFDFARAIRPNWTQQRFAGPGTLQRWVNVYSKIDLFGSNFSDRTKTEIPDLEVAKIVVRTATRDDNAGALDTDLRTTPITAPTDNVSWGSTIEDSLPNLLAFHGFSSHGLYWSENGSQTSVFQQVVPKLYSDTSVLAALP